MPHLHNQQRHFFPALTYTTGDWLAQPARDDRRLDWYLDAGLNLIDSAGCLDAPTQIPSGSVRALDTGRVTIAVASLTRDEVQ